MELILLIVIGYIVIDKIKAKNNRNKLYVRKSSEPSFEEWKAAQNKQNQEQVTHNTEQETNTASKPNDEIDYRQAYQAKRIFSKNEWQNYKKLRDVAEVKGYIVCPKVRLLDIIEPRRGEKKYKTLFYKVQAKHVDFVICDQDMNIKAIIELDDSSHDTKERQERDQFVDLILRSVGYKVIHTRYINYDILDLV